MNFFNNKTAVITGGGGVLCSEFAYALADKGANVVVMSRTESSSAKVADKINSNGGKAIAIAADVLDTQALINAHKVINEKFGKVDILINGAGGNNPKGTTTNEYYEKGDIDKKDLQTFFNMEKQGFDAVFDLNMMGTLLPTQVFGADMIGRENCTIINISSMNAFTPLTKIPAYSSAKAAVSNFTQWLAVHFAKEGIRVNAIAPGFFVTKQNEALLFEDDGTPTARTKKILAATPMDRFGEPSELIGTLLWLADSNKSSFVTGTVIPVDGGFSAYSGV